MICVDDMTHNYRHIQRPKTSRLFRVWYLARVSSSTCYTKLGRNFMPHEMGFRPLLVGLCLYCKGMHSAGNTLEPQEEKMNLHIGMEELKSPGP